jgi:hypothetical protein
MEKYHRPMPSPRAAHAKIPEKQKATPKDDLCASYLWLPDLDSNQGPAD